MNAMREAVAALLRSRGYTHDDQTDRRDLYWYSPRLGVRPMLSCLAYEISCDTDGGEASGWDTYEVSVAVPL